MNWQLLLGAILRSTAIIARDPQLADRSDIAAVLGNTADIITASPQLEADLQALTLRIETLVAEGRSFTDEERTELRAESDALSERLAELAAQRSNN